MKISVNFIQRELLKREKSYFMHEQIKLNVCEIIFHSLYRQDWLTEQRKMRLLLLSLCLLTLLGASSSLQGRNEEEGSEKHTRNKRGGSYYMTHTKETGRKLWFHSTVTNFEKQTFLYPWPLKNTLIFLSFNYKMQCLGQTPHIPLLESSGNSEPGQITFSLPFLKSLGLPQPIGMSIPLHFPNCSLPRTVLSVN